MPSAHNTSTGSAGPFTSKPNEGMKRGLQGNPGELDLKTFSPESEKWETPIRQEPANWEKTPGRTAGLPSWPEISDTNKRHVNILISISRIEVLHYNKFQAHRKKTTQTPRGAHPHATTAPCRVKKIHQIAGSFRRCHQLGPILPWHKAARIPQNRRRPSDRRQRDQML